jgi:RNA-directed DNA polymerase
MSREAHVQFCESLGVRFPGATHLVVTGISKEILELNVLPAVREFMSIRGLDLSEEKTRITHIAEGFDFLGQNVRKYNNKLLIKPAPKSVKALMAKVREIVKKNASATQANLILQLNPVRRRQNIKVATYRI